MGMLVEGDKVVAVDEAEEVHEVCDSYVVHQGAHVRELAFVGAGKHQLVPLAAVACELSNRVEQRCVVLVRPELGGIEDVRCGEPQSLDSFAREWLAASRLAREGRRRMRETENALRINSEVANDLVSAGGVRHNDACRLRYEA